MKKSVIGLMLLFVMVAVSLGLMAEKTANATTSMYSRNFNDGDLSGLAIVNNPSAVMEINNGNLRVLSSSGDVFVIDNDSMSQLNGSYQFRMRPSDGARLGGIIRYVDTDTYTWIGYENTGHWRIREVINGVHAGDIYLKRTQLSAYNWYDVVIRYEGKAITVTCNSEVVYDGLLQNSQAPVAGKIGFVGWSVTDNLYDDVVQSNQYDTTYVLENDQVSVTLDRMFPQSFDYTVKDTGGMLYGADKASVPKVILNGTAYDATVTGFSDTGNQVEYDVQVHGMDVRLKYQFSLEGQALVRRLTEVTGTGEGQVETIKLSTPILRTTEEQSGAYGIYTYIDDGLLGNSHTIRDVAGDVSYFNKLISPVYEYTDWPFIWHDSAVGAVYNNVYDLPFIIVGEKNSSGKKTISVYDNRYHYRVGNVKPGLMFEGKTYIGSESNENQDINWQDGALWVRKQMPQMPESLKALFAGGGNWHQVHGAFQDEQGTLGGASQVITSFSQALEAMKRIYNQTDGAGQVMAYVGWNGYGHDYAYPDWGTFFNPGIGTDDSAKAYRTEMAKYNGELSFHVNADDMYEGSPAWDNNILALNSTGNKIKSWQYGVMPTAYSISHYKDYINGSMDLRRETFLDRFWTPQVIYQDVMLVKYSDYEGYYDAEERFAMKMQADGFRNRGVYMATEYYQPFHRRNGVFVYKSRWGDSKVDNFINAGQTIYAKYYEDNSSYPGAGYKEVWGQLSSSERWGNMNPAEITGIIKDTFIYAMPASYMRQYEALEWFDNAAEYKIRFADGVVSRWDKQSGTYTLTHGNVILADGNDRFMPDDLGEEKIYVFYDGLKTKEWQLPDSWSVYADVDLYEMTESGYAFAARIPVSNGKVQVMAYGETPYVLMPAQGILMDQGPVKKTAVHTVMNDSVEVDFGNETRVNRIELSYGINDITAYDVSVYDDNQWVTLVSGTDWPADGRLVTPSADTQNLKISFTGSNLSMADMSSGLAFYGDTNLAIGKGITATSEKAHLFGSVGSFSYTYKTGAGMVNDGDVISYWSADGQTQNVQLELDLGRLMTFDRIVLMEEGSAVTQFSVRYMSDTGQWIDLVQGTSVGECLEIDFAEVEGQKVQLVIHQASGEPRLNEIEVYDVGGIQY